MNQQEQQIEAIRHFNRFYTKRIGVVTDQYLDSPFSLTQARIIYELAQRDSMTATELRSELGLDAGYLSRILRDFEKRQLVKKARSQQDRRQTKLYLTEKGKEAIDELNDHSRQAIATMLTEITAEESQKKLIDAMQTIETLLSPIKKPAPAFILRPHQPGDLGWIIAQHGKVYADEYGWNEQFEAFVAEIAARFIQQFNPKKERCWIAESEGQIIGAVILVEHEADIAKLRLLIVDPKARGLGVGSRLVEECIRFARQSGYKKLMLWTNSILHSARHIYEKAGFRMIEEEAHHSFGQDLVGETWELELK